MSLLMEQNTVRDRLRKDANAICLGNLFTVDAHLHLPSSGKHGSVIRWMTLNPDRITAEGRISRPAYGEGNAQAMLIAELSLEDETAGRRFELTILEQERVRVAAEVLPFVVEVPEGTLPTLPGMAILRFDDGTNGVAPVKWDAVPDADMQGASEARILRGTVEGTELPALLTLKRAYPCACAGHRLPVARSHPFALDQVELLPSLFTENRDRTKTFLLSLDAGQLLYNFRQAANLDTEGAAPMDGWDAPDCNLRGHTTGHCLSALAQAYAEAREPAFKEKLDALVIGLARCQEAFSRSGTTGPGFLSAYSEEQFDQLESMTTYPIIWAPYYTLHKIMAGLLDAFELAGIHPALAICIRLGHWVCARLGRLPRGQRTAMWSMYIAGEFGGMNEVMARLHGLTEDPAFLEAAAFFDNEKLYIPMAQGVDTLGGMHANQHIPQIIGVLKTYAVGGDETLLRMASHFWDMTVSDHLYSIGGTGEGEMFRQAGRIARHLGDRTAETCATYNLLKLTRDLYRFSPEPRYMAYAERALYNHILPSQDRSGPTGGSTYFLPLHPGAVKTYDEDGNSCCHGTGMENHTKYQELIWFKDADGNGLVLNQYIPSRLHWAERGLSLTLSGDWLREHEMQLEISGSCRLALKLRVPDWATDGFFIEVNGKPEDAPAIVDSLVVLDRSWNSGDIVRIRACFRFRRENTPDNPLCFSLRYGPLVMAALSHSDQYMKLPLQETALNLGVESTEDPLTFRVGEITLVPLCLLQDEAYHVYFMDA